MKLLTCTLIALVNVSRVSAARVSAATQEIAPTAAEDPAPVIAPVAAPVVIPFLPPVPFTTPVVTPFLPPVVPATPQPTVRIISVPQPVPDISKPSSQPTVLLATAPPTQFPTFPPKPTLAPVTGAPVLIAPVTFAPVTSVPDTTLPPNTISPGTSVPGISAAPVTSVPVGSGAPFTSVPVAPTPTAPTATTSQPAYPVYIPVSGSGFDLSGTYDSVGEMIKAVALNGGTEFEDPISYQSVALAWLEISPATFESNAKNLQRYALACLIMSTYQKPNDFTSQEFEDSLPAWNNTDGWLSEDDECTWYGIECDTRGFVISLDLLGNFLTGYVPEELVYLANTLQYLDLSFNVVANEYGKLDWIGGLTSLRFLYLGYSYLQYPGIPEGIGNLVNLEEIDLSYCMFHGPIRPGIWENLEKLSYIEIGGNSFNTRVPTTVSTLPNLKYLYIENTNMLGDLSFLADMTEIVEFWVDNNGITGTIPTEVGDLFNLSAISLTGNELRGTIPSEFGMLKYLKDLWLYSNQLTGTIPPELAHAKNLEILMLDGNDLVGEMPSSICLLRDVVNAGQDAAGKLSILSADCMENSTEVTCAAVWCCTCCTYPCDQ